MDKTNTPEEDYEDKEYARRDGNYHSRSGRQSQGKGDNPEVIIKIGTTIPKERATTPK